MANLNQILHRKKSDGTYDDVYLRANMANVIGTLAVANGGTGATDAATACTNLSAVSSAPVFISNLNIEDIMKAGKSGLFTGMNVTNAPTVGTDIWWNFYVNMQSTLWGTVIAVHLTDVNKPIYKANLVNGVMGAWVEYSSVSRQTSDTAPTTLLAGRLLVGNTKMWFGNSSNKPVEVLDMGGTINIGTINGNTIDAILNKMVDKKIGIHSSGGSSGTAGTSSGAVSAGILEGALISGETVKFDGMYWTVVHTDYVNRLAYLGCNQIVTETKFHDSSSVYSTSTLKTVAANFQAAMSSEALSYMADVTVNSVTSKVFVPSREQVNGDFSYFATQNSRICEFNGEASEWWTSSPDSSTYAYYVTTTGAISNGYGLVSRTYGFRPFCCLKI